MNKESAEEKKLICQDCSKKFLVIKQEDAFYRKKDLPLPKRCPECRRNIRLSFKNPRKLSQRKCDNCGKDILTTYPPEAKYKIYCQDCYWKEMQ